MNENLKMKTDEKISEQKMKSSNDNNKIISQYTIRKIWSTWEV